jgi:deoxycytidylate deaminase
LDGIVSKCPIQDAESSAAGTISLFKLTETQVGCVLVDPRDRILSLQCSGESHAIVRAILSAPRDPHGCDIYVSRFPCSLCTKMMVQVALSLILGIGKIYTFTQAGIRKIYYFPAKGLEMDWDYFCEQQCEGLSKTFISL